MVNRKRYGKVVIIGAGYVGTAYAYAMLNQSICDEIVLIDINENKALGEAMDLRHGLSFSQSSMKIHVGNYADCEDADIVTISVGAPQNPGESRLELAQKNILIFSDIIPKVTKSGFNGIFIVATNPVDVMSMATYRFSGFASQRVIGTGTTLDTARLRSLLGGYFNVDSHNVHAYVMGEHGDSEFVPWSQAYISTKLITHICNEHPLKYHIDDLERISENVKKSAYKIIEYKKATYYGIGMALARITRAILRDENTVLTVSAMLEGEYGISNVWAGAPCIVGGTGICGKIQIELNSSERRMLLNSCEIIRASYNNAVQKQSKITIT